jgi:hypothetical protein
MKSPDLPEMFFYGICKVLLLFGAIWNTIFYLNMVLMGRVLVFNTTFNSISVISWRSVLLMEQTGGVPWKNTDISQVTNFTNLGFLNFANTDVIRIRSM